MGCELKERPKDGMLVHYKRMARKSEVIMSEVHYSRINMKRETQKRGMLYAHIDIKKCCLCIFFKKSSFFCVIEDVIFFKSCNKNSCT